jgi:hypothetical protein
VFLVSIFVIGVVLSLSIGQPIPAGVVEYLDRYVPNDGSSTSNLIAIGFGLGMFAAFTPANLMLRYFATVVHELGHALTAGAMFARPKSIYIHPSSSGLATWEIPLNWGRFRATLVAAAGYPAPSLASLAAMNAIVQGRLIAWSMFSVGVLAMAVLLLIRNVWGFLWTSAVIGGSYYAYGAIPIDVAGAIVSGVAGFLAVSSVQFAWTQLTLARRMRGTGIDAEAIEAYTKIPSKVIAFGHLLLTLGVGYLAAKLAIEPKWDDIVNWSKDFWS